MEEIWKSIENYEGYYEVSNLGNVRSIDRIVPTLNSKYYKFKSILLKPSKSGSGYLAISLVKNSKAHTITIHILVAKAFIINSENKPTVNHIDGNKYNNNVLNLEWATKSEQSIHALKNGLSKIPMPWVGKYGLNHPMSKQIIQLDLKNNLIAEYESIIDAKRKTNITTIDDVLAGRQKTGGGFIWKYK